MKCMHARVSQPLSVPSSHAASGISRSGLEQSCPPDPDSGTLMWACHIAHACGRQLAMTRAGQPATRNTRASTPTRSSRIDSVVTLPVSGSSEPGLMSGTNYNAANWRAAAPWYGDCWCRNLPHLGRVPRCTPNPTPLRWSGQPPRYCTSGETSAQGQWPRHRTYLRT